MADFHADAVDEISIPSGATCTLESIRLDFHLPGSAAMPFLETPAHVALERQVAHEDAFGRRLVFTLRGERTGTGLLRVGYREFDSDVVIAQKTVRVTVS